MGGIPGELFFCSESRERSHGSQVWTGTHVRYDNSLPEIGESGYCTIIINWRESYYFGTDFFNKKKYFQTPKIQISVSSPGSMSHEVSKKYILGDGPADLLDY